MNESHKVIRTDFYAKEITIDLRKMGPSSNTARELILGALSAPEFETPNVTFIE